EADRTTVASSSTGSTETSGVPSSTQKLRCSSVKVFLQVGQRFTFSFSSLLPGVTSRGYERFYRGFRRVANRRHVCSGMRSVPPRGSGWVSLACSTRNCWNPFRRDSESTTHPLLHGGTDLMPQYL